MRNRHWLKHWTWVRVSEAASVSWSVASGDGRTISRKRQRSGYRASCCELLCKDRGLAAGHGNIRIYPGLCSQVPGQSLPHRHGHPECRSVPSEIRDHPCNRPRKNHPGQPPKHGVADHSLASGLEEQVQRPISAATYPRQLGHVPPVQVSKQKRTAHFALLR